MPKGLEVEGILKRYGSEAVLREVTFSIDGGKTGVVVGTSGAGKTTLLNIVAGLLAADGGRISIDGRLVESVDAGRSVVHLRPSERNIGYVFQDYLLFPHMTIFENVAYGLRARHASQQLIDEKVRWVLGLTDLKELASRKPSQVSGGQMQRAALARALVTEPSLVLLDEPLSALDRQTRESLRIGLKRTFESLSTTALYVTHDLDEAFFFGEEIGIMVSGRLSYFNSKRDLLSHMTDSTADFLGFNVLKVRLLNADSSGCLFAAADLDATIKVPVPPRIPVGEDAVIAVPPESVRISTLEDTETGGVEVVVRDVWEFKNTVRIAVGRSDKWLVGEIPTVQFQRHPLERGERVRVHLDGAFFVSGTTGLEEEGRTREAAST